MKTVIIDYGSGNLRSAAKAFERASTLVDGKHEITVSNQAEIVQKADRLVLPGVGAFADCRLGLQQATGLEEALIEAVETRGRPFFGICVGMQLMARRGLEKQVTSGLGWINGDVKQIEPVPASLKVPHMGWNTLEQINAHPLLDELPLGGDGLHAYFVHSYHLADPDADQLLAVSDYGGPVTAIVGRDNMIGTQFHPEKSQQLGLGLIANFLNWAP